MRVVVPATGWGSLFLERRPGGTAVDCFAHLCPYFHSSSTSVTAGTNKGHSGADHAHLAKLDRENEVAPPAKIAPTVGKAIGQARQAKGWTQKDLGQRINEKPQVIQDFEGSKATPNPQILAKMERALGVKLRGKDIGAPLGGPKK